MKKEFLIRAGEVLCVLLLGLFIFFITGNDSISDKTVKQVEKDVVKVFDVKKLQEIDKKQFKKQLKLDPDSFDGYCYYASDSVMDVREVLIIKLKDTAQAEDVMAALSSRVTQKNTLFENYAPKESDLLKNHVLVSKSGFVYFAVGKNAAKALEAFKSSL